MTAGRTVRAGAHHWGTPRDVVDRVHGALKGVELDPCGGPESIVDAAVTYEPPVDGLAESWNASSIFVNPPYGRDYATGTTIRDWIARCHLAHIEHGAQVIALVPVATNTRHWKGHVLGGAATSVCFLAASRLKFRIDGSEHNKGCPMAVAAVYWGHAPERFAEHFAAVGAVVDLRPGAW